MNVKVAKAEISDIKELNKISIESKMYWGYPPEWMQRWRDAVTLTEKDFQRQTIFKLLNEFGLSIGFCSIQENVDEYEIIHLWIKPFYIGKGHGKYLLSECIECVVVKNKPIIVEANPNAESFYSNQGFETYERRPSFPEGRFLPIMKKCHITTNLKK